MDIAPGRETEPSRGLTAIAPNHLKAFRSLIYETSPKSYPASGKKHSPWSTRNRAHQQEPHGSD